MTDDTRILRHLNTVRAQVSEWRKDPKIDQLHEQGVDWRKKKARSLLDQSDPFYTMTHTQQMGDTVTLDFQEQRRLLDQLFRVRHLIDLEKSITNREKPNGVHTE